MVKLDALLALGVVVSTAATDAVYVMFNSAVSSKTARAGGYVEQRLVSAFGVCGDQLYEELGVCLFCCGGVVDWGLSFDDMVEQGQRDREGRRTV